MFNSVELTINCFGHENIWSNCTFSVDHYCWDSVYLDCGGQTLSHELAELEQPNYAKSENLLGFGLTNNTNGILYMHDGWVCHDYFTDDTANVICAEMGMGRSITYQTARVTSSPDWSRYFGAHEFGMNFLHCQLNAKDLDNCTWHYTHDCSFAEGVSMSCENNTISLASVSRSSWVAITFLIVFIIFVVIILTYCWIVNKKQVSGMKCCNVLRSPTLKTYHKVNEVEENTGQDAGVELPVTVVSENEIKLQLEVDRLRAEIARLKAGGTSEQTTN